LESSAEGRNKITLLKLLITEKWALVLLERILVDADFIARNF